MIPTDSKKSFAQAEYHRAIEAADAEYDRARAAASAKLNRALVD
jgi:hypothetical protein